MRPPLPRSRKAKRVTAVALMALSGLMLAGAGWVAAYPFYTDLRAGRFQQELQVTFVSAETKNAYQEGQIEEGSPLTRIVIPKLGVDTIVVAGTSPKALAAGAGHYPGTPLPGEPGNVGIAGHSGMNGKPFAGIDRLEPGDLIQLITPFAKHTYELVPSFGGHANPWVTVPNDWSVVAPSAEPMLTLTTCYPKGSAKKRLIVRAKLIASESLA